MARKTKESRALNPVLILHGWAYNYNKWSGFASTLSTFGYDTKILKIPGLTEDNNRLFTIEDYVKWLDKKIQKFKHKPIVIGHSNGGRIALNYLSKHNSKVKHLILINSAGIHDRRLVVIIKKSIFRLIAKTGKKFTGSLVLKRMLYKLARERDYMKANKNMKLTMINLLASDKNLDFSKISTPVTIIWGERDRTTPLYMGILMHKYIPDSKLHIIKTASHSLPFTHQKQIIDIIKSNLSI